MGTEKSLLLIGIPNPGSSTLQYYSYYAVLGSTLNRGSKKVTQIKIRTFLTPHSKAIPEIPSDGHEDNEKHSCRLWIRRVISVFTKTPHSFRLSQGESSPHPPIHFFQIHGAKRQLRQNGTSIFCSYPTHFAIIVAANLNISHISSPLFATLFYTVKK